MVKNPMRCEWLSWNGQNGGEGIEYNCTNVNKKKACAALKISALAKDVVLTIPHWTRPFGFCFAPPPMEL